MNSPILKSFKIKGLHGYKDVEIDFTSSVRVLIAGNGSGKTTIFNALYATLSRYFHRLSTLDFNFIVCNFEGCAEEVVINKKDVLDVPQDIVSRIESVAERIPGISEEELISFLQSDYIIGGIEEQLPKSPTLNRIYMHLPGGYSAVGSTLDELAELLHESENNKIKDASDKIKEAMHDVRVMYLPTYRRIELPLLKTKKSRHCLVFKKMIRYLLKPLSILNILILVWLMLSAVLMSFQKAWKGNLILNTEVNRPGFPGGSNS